MGILAIRHHGLRDDPQPLYLYYVVNVIVGSQVYFQHQILNVFLSYLIKFALLEVLFALKLVSDAWTKWVIIFTLLIEMIS